MVRVGVEKTYGPTRRRVAQQLRRYNSEAIGKIENKPVAVTVRDNGEVIGGLVGWTFLGWMFIEMLWISDEHRGKGLGRRLVEKAESEARKRGVANVYLDTFDFQAPGFYQKLGYRDFGKLKDFPAGQSRHWMTKTL